MNIDEKKLKVDNDGKICKIPVSTNKSIRHPTKPCYDTHPSSTIKELKLSSREQGKTYPGGPKAVTKQFCYIVADRGPQIHESGRKFPASKFCAAQLDNPGSKTVRDAKNQIKQEKRYSKVSVSDEKSNASASRKRQSASKSNRDNVIDIFNGNIFKKTLFKADMMRSPPKAEEVSGKAIPSLATERVHRQSYKDKYCNGKKEESSRPASKASEKVNRKQGSYSAKKYSDKINVKDNNKGNSEKIHGNFINKLGKTKENKNINAKENISVKKSVDKKIIRNDNEIDRNIEDSGAARTRIFKWKRSSQIDKMLGNCKESIGEKKAECSRKKFRTKKSFVVEEHSKDKPEKKTEDQTERICEQGSVISSDSDEVDNIISPYNRGLLLPESSTDCNQYQKAKETFLKSAGERTNNNSTGSETNCEELFPGNTKNDVSQENVSILNNVAQVCWNDDVSEKDDGELITGPTEITNNDSDNIRRSETVSKIAYVFQDEITYHTNSMNYEYHYDNRYCKPPNKQQNIKYTVNETVKSSIVDENQSSVSDDAKYNLIKALIQPITEINRFKSTVDNNVPELIPSGQRCEHIIASKDEAPRNHPISSLSNDRMNGGTTNVSNSVKESHDNAHNSKSCEIWSPCTSSIHLKQPLSNTSDYIAMNLKMKSCKHPKKYRHFKYEEKNMCCDMARYIRRMVSDEIDYRGNDKREIPEREEVKIIIGENSPKTSRIRIVNDRSSISVVCHSLGRTLSPCRRENDPIANKAESSGGESSGYKSLQNNSNTKNVDVTADEIQIKKSDEQHDIKDSVMYHEPSAKPFYNRATLRNSENVCDSPYVDNTVDSCDYRIIENPDSQYNAHDECHKKRNTETKYSLCDAKNYLSTFTNCMDVYLPCEITAYQLEETQRSKILLLNNKEPVEKAVNNAGLYVGKYSRDKNLGTRDEFSEREGSSQRLSSAKDFMNSEDEMIMLKKPDHLKYDSLEFVVDERLLEPENPERKPDSGDLPVVRGQYKIVTSMLDMKPAEITESTEKLMSASHVRFNVKDDESLTDVRFYNGNNQSNQNSATLLPIPQAATKDSYERSRNYRFTCPGRPKKENHRMDDSNSNIVHELWTNTRSTVDSTDNDSQSSGTSRCGVGGSKKHDTNKIAFNRYTNSKSASGKRINVPLDHLPKPPASFLETSAPSCSTKFSSDTDAYNSEFVSELDITKKSDTPEAPIRQTSSILKSHVEIAPIHYNRKTIMDTISDETIDHPESLKRDLASILPRHNAEYPESSVTPMLDETQFLRSEQLPSAIPPPASALPSPYPFCCPFVPYMMHYWQNNQQPPPASTIPLPEADWKQTVSVIGANPPPPGMVPIPWFPPINMNNSPLSGARDARMLRSSQAEPPLEWPTMPIGYAPCLPCSRMLESHLGTTNSSIHEDVEPARDSSEIKQDGKKIKVSNKLLKIFRRKNRADVDTLHEDDRKMLKGKYQQPRSDANKQNIMHIVQNDQKVMDDHSIWESPDIAGIVTPEEIGRCFRRGFRADGLTLSGDDYLCTKAPSDTTSVQQDVFNLSDHDTPLDFLLALGFSVDEATAAIRDDEVRSRFKAALTEARIWVPHIATTQGTLLYLLAMKAKPKVMRYFLQLVESIVNKRITNAVKLDAYLKILEKVEEGYLSFVTLFGKDAGKDDEEDTVIAEKQRRRILYTIYKYAESEAKAVDRPLTKASVDLLHSLAARYRPAIGPHLRLLACYIGEGHLTKDVQLEAALIYLSRLDSSDIELEDLEKYCGLPRSERRRIEQIARTRSSEDEA